MQERAITYDERLTQQMRNTRFQFGRFERLENGEWVPWPVLTIDRLGQEEAQRVVATSRPKRAWP